MHCESVNSATTLSPPYSVIVTTVQYLSSALHKNFTETDFDFKVGAPETSALFVMTLGS